MATLFIAGAGCSFGTLHGHECLRPPIAKDFVRDLKHRVPTWASEYPEIKKVVDHLNESQECIGLEELWTCIDLHAKFLEAFPIGWNPRGPVVQELKRILVRMYGRACDELADRIAVTDGCTVVEKVAKVIEDGDTLISFNYDTVIERIVRNLSNRQLLHGKDLRPGTVRFAKPHGSASWSIQELGYRVTDGEPLWDSMSEDDVKRGVKDPLLLGAVPLKSELVFEVQEYYHARRVFEVILEQWRTLANAVATADRIVVLGYSFPKEDAYGRFFFREGMAMRQGRPLEVEVYSRSMDGQALFAVFPTAGSICSKGKVTPAAT